MADDSPSLLSTSRLHWYYNRLSRMSLAEMTFRAHRALGARLQRVGIGSVRSIPDWDTTASSFTNYVSVPGNIDHAPVIERAKRIMRGDYAFFLLDGQGLLGTLDWNRDPLTGVRAPLIFGRALDYRDEKVVGNIKYLWEPNRHIHLTWLAQGYAVSGDVAYLDEIRRHLSSWFEQCPYQLGPNWSSALESGIRLINWSLVWQWVGGPKSELFQGEKGRLFRDQWLSSIYQHVHFTRGFYSRHSSANNHLVGELAGVFIATLTWPYWPEFAAWGRRAKELLQQQALIQNGEDGVNREQAISYQQFVADFLLLCGLAARANNNDFSSDYWSRLELMLDYIASVMDVAGNVPMIGDADDGYVVRLTDASGFCPYRSLLATGAVLFRRGDFKEKAAELDEKSLWLLGQTGRGCWEDLEGKRNIGPVRSSFPDAGYYVLGCNFETPAELRIVADAGPLGYLSIAAHGHCDALAFTLSYGGSEFLIDPGTYAYHTEPKWRQYFRGTSAHNTVRVDNQDQSIPGGSFMWLRHAHAQCTKWVTGEEADNWVAEHDGYLRLEDPVVHQRQIELDKKTLSCVVRDTFKCVREHVVERFWHFAEHCDVSLSGNRVVAKLHGKHLDIEITERDSELELVSGDSQRPLGWVSRRFGVKHPTTTVVVRNRIAGTCVLSTHIGCRGATRGGL